VELASYAERAVALVNTEDPYRQHDTLTTVRDARELLIAQGASRARRVTHSDLSELRRLRGQLREIFDAIDANAPTRGVDILNQLLARYPIRPQINDHDGSGWHLHLSEGASVAAAYGATACMGLATQATEVGVDRLGVCQAAPCREVFIDTSTNRSRRYCSDRCATRANVAAYRARRRKATQHAALAAAHAAERQDAEAPVPLTSSAVG
jgi:predicted RNA-binding Zn ribbon-like protein